MAKKDKAHKKPDEPEEDDVEETKEPAPEEASPKGAENEGQGGEPGVPPPSPGSHKITIEGEEGDPLPLSVRGEMRSLPRGVEIEVGDDIMNVLEGSSVKFKRGKK